MPQLRLEAFYTFNERFAKIRNQRIKKAIKGINRRAFVAQLPTGRPGRKSRVKRKGLT
jgi:hypothetical protein